MPIFAKKTLQKRARFHRQATKEQGKRRFRKMHLESLSARELFAADLGLIDDGLQAQAYYADVQSTLNAKIDAAPAPFIGTTLSEELGTGGSIHTSSQFIDAVGHQFDALNLESQSTVSQVKAQLRSAFGISEDAITVTGEDGDSDIRFDITLTGSQRYVQGVALDLVGADPEIDLRAGGEDQVELDLTWSYTLSFGVREDAQGNSEFYRDTTPTSEVIIDFTATVKESFTEGRGKVGVFFGEIGIDQDEPTRVSQFTGRYTMDLSVDEAGQTVMAGSLTGAGEAHLDVAGSFAPAGSDALVNLGLTADGRVEYSTDVEFLIDGTVDWSDNEVTVAMENVTVDLGKIYTDFVDPLIGDLQENLKPLKPVVEFLTEPLPVISDISRMAGQGSVTALSLAGYGPDHPLTKTLGYLDAILDYRGLTGASNSENESLLSFNLSKSGLDSQSAADQQADRESRLQHFKENGLQIELADKHKNPEDHAEWESSLAWSAEFGGSIDVPFLTDSDTLVGFLLGDTQSEFFTFELDANFAMGLEVDIPITALLNMVSLVGGIDVDFSLDLDGGYDATGIDLLSAKADYSSQAAFDASVSQNTDLLLNGFYLDDHNVDANGNVGLDNGAADKPEATLQVKVGAGLKAGLDVIIASLEIEGRAILETDLEFDLNDLPEPAATDANGNPIWSNITESERDHWTYDGRLRIPELTTIVNSNPGSLFNMSGVLQAGMDAAVEAKVLGFTVYEKDWELFRVTLIDEKISESDDLKTILGENPPQLGSLTADASGSQTLNLFVGEQANRRNIDTHVQDENFTVQSLGQSRDGGETVMVTFESGGKTYTQFFHGVTKIVANGGSGNDAITVLPGLTSDVTIDGGAGDDTLVALGLGQTILVGGEGDDTLRGGNGDDIISGGLGNDFIDGGNGNDTLHGNEGNDVILGSGGNDILYGDDGEDQLRGGNGDDVLWGGNHDDQLEGGFGSDEIYGEGGEDRIQYAFTFQEEAGEKDTIRGGADLDILEILGSEAADHIQIAQLNATDFQVTSASEDEETGEFKENSSFQFSLPEAVEDRDVERVQVSGLGGDDQITAIGKLNVNELRLAGGDGDDTITGADSRNVILGEDGNDTLIGGDDEDVIRGGEGNDEIHGGAERDNLHGDQGDDIIFGGAGRDMTYGGAGNDELWASASRSNFLDESDQDELGDVIKGEEGDDTIHGGRGHDELHGGNGNDRLIAWEDPTIATAANLIGDSLYGGGGDDHLTGSHLEDTLDGGAGSDKIIHTAGRDLIDGGGSEDDGELDQYIVLGTEGNDIIDFEFREDGEGGTPDVTVNVNGNQVRTNHHGIEIAGVNALGGDDIIGQQFGVNAGTSGGIAIYAGAGNDQIHLDGYQNNAIVMGGSGNDRLRFELFDGDNTITLDDETLTTDQLTSEVQGIEFAELTGNAAGNGIDVSRFSGNTKLSGLAGNDRIVVGKGSDQVFGGEGLDTVVAQGDVNFQLTDAALQGLGYDALDSVESAELTGGASDNHLIATGFTKGGVTLNGGEGEDYLRGTNHDDELHGGDGRDFIYGYDGNDRIYGGRGHDALFGQDGNDWMHGGAHGNDYLYGGNGNDHLIGSWDYLYGDAGNDTLEVDRDYFNSINYVSKGGAGNDVVKGGNGNDILNGNDGNDTLYGYGGNDKIYGGNGNDYLSGGSGHDTMWGHGGNDRLYGGSGADKLYGMDGRDVLRGESGSDYLDGGKDGTWDDLDGGTGYDTAKQHRKWIKTWAWFGYWKNQDRIVNVESIRNDSWS